MKIGYIYLLFNDSSFGIWKKIEDQKEALMKLKGDNLEIIVLNTKKELSSGNLKYVKYRFVRFPFINNFFLLFAKYFLISKTIDTSIYDKIILRYPGADISGCFFMKKHKNVYFELHANVADELKSKIKHTNSILRKIIRIVKLYQELIFWNPIVKRSVGIISKSDEVTNNLNRSLKKNVRDCTIGNGVNTLKTTKTSFSFFDGKTLKVVFVGSRPDSWHGLDRLVLSVEQYLEKKPLKNVELHFIGNITSKDLNPKEIENRMFFHGLKYGEELDEIMVNMHIAVCPLALYRKKLDEISALKTCEYTARGIPFIIAYNDPNLFKVDNKKIFFKQFPNDDSIIDFNEVFEFMNTMQKRKNEILNYMEEYTNEYLDWKIKLNEYIDFVSMPSNK